MESDESYVLSPIFQMSLLSTAPSMEDTIKAGVEKKAEGGSEHFPREKYRLSRKGTEK
jgi:hypothetical protein